jgi:hypothetical protein
LAHLADFRIMEAIPSGERDNAMGREYIRSTEICTFDQLRPELSHEIRAHIQKYNLGNVLDDILICVETAARKKKNTGILGKLIGGDPDPIHYTAILVTPKWFIGARTGSQSGNYAISARLSDVTVRDYDQGHLIPDYGIFVFGLMTDMPERVESFWGLGEDEAGDRLKQILYAQVEQGR